MFLAAFQVYFALYFQLPIFLFPEKILSSNALYDQQYIIYMIFNMKQNIIQTTSCLDLETQSLKQTTQEAMLKNQYVFSNEQKTNHALSKGLRRPQFLKNDATDDYITLIILLFAFVLFLLFSSHSFYFPSWANSTFKNNIRIEADSKTEDSTVKLKQQNSPTALPDKLILQPLILVENQQKPLSQNNKEDKADKEVVENLPQSNTNDQNKQVKQQSFKQIKRDKIKVEDNLSKQKKYEQIVQKQKDNMKNAQEKKDRIESTEPKTNKQNQIKKVKQQKKELNPTNTVPETQGKKKETVKNSENKKSGKKQEKIIENKKKYIKQPNQPILSNLKAKNDLASSSVQDKQNKSQNQTAKKNKGQALSKQHNHQKLDTKVSQTNKKDKNKINEKKK